MILFQLPILESGKSEHQPAHKITTYFSPNWGSQMAISLYTKVFLHFKKWLLTIW